MINNMISISLDGKPCVSEAYYVLFIYNSINLILVRVERKSLIRKTLILIRVPFVSVRFSLGGQPLGRGWRSIRSLPRRPLHGDRAGVPASPAAWAKSRELQRRRGRSAVHPAGRARPRCACTIRPSGAGTVCGGCRQSKCNGARHLFRTSEESRSTPCFRKPSESRLP